MPRRLTALFLAGCSLFVAACGGSTSGNSGGGCPQAATTPSSKVKAPPNSDLVKAGTLTFGSDISYSYPPQEFYPRGCGGHDPDGFDIDVAKALAAHMGLKFAVVDTKFDTLITSLQDRKFDAVISAMTITDERKKAAQFVPYLMAGESFVVSASSKKNPKEIKDLCGLRVAVEKGTTEESDVQDANDPAQNGVCAKNPIDFKNSDFDNDTPALAALRKGTVDVHFTDSPVAQYELMKNGGLKVTNARPINAAAEGIATRINDTALGDAMNAAFSAMKKDGTYKSLLDRWKLAGGDITKAS